MPVKCASPRDCGDNVEADKHWCSECQEEAARSDLPGAAVALARVPNLDPTYQALILNSPSVMARMQLALRTDLDPRIRHELLRDQDAGVVFVASASPHADPNDLYRLIEGADRELAMVLAGQASMPLRGLRLLCDHEDTEIRTRARHTFRIAWRATHPEEAVRSAER